MDGNTALNTAGFIGSVQSAKFLIQNGADLNSRGEYDATPLINACLCGKTKGSQIALLLIEAGADVQKIQGKDHTALDSAAAHCSGAVIQALIDHGASVDGVRNKPMTPLMIAARNSNVDALRVLIENGADRSRKCRLPWAEGRTAEGLAELENRTKRCVFFVDFVSDADRTRP